MTRGDDVRWRAINSVLGVARLVAATDAPIAVPEAMIEGLRAREGKDGCVRLEPQRHLKNDDKVRALIDPEALAAA